MERTPLYDQRVVVAIDVQKAFDSVPHESVIKGAKNMGFNGRILAFIETFLHATVQGESGWHTGTPSPQRNWSTAGVGALAYPLQFGDGRASHSAR